MTNLLLLISLSFLTSYGSYLNLLRLGLPTPLSIDKHTFLNNEYTSPLESTDLNNKSFPLFNLIIKYLWSMKGGISRFRCFINLIITSSINPLILNVATLSRGVDYKFTITSLDVYPVIRAISAAGVTVNELPNAIHKSDYSPHLNPLFISFSGKFSPKFIILSCSLPLHY